MAFENGWWPPFFSEPTPAQMRTRQQDVPWQQPQNKPTYAFMVNNEQAARRFPVPLGEKAFLFDKERSVFYFKEVDGYNDTKFTVYEYAEITETGSDADYVTRAELNEILARMTGGAPEPAKQENSQREPTTAQRRRRMAMEEMNDEQSGV